ncbi:hypothetical protein SAMN05421759_102523 [Roseivivax lentus]|uniref:PEP-CTERM protein-sorting domain-containing protein n=1 Tax=Roseivivax lentus TaxID=633194 RepID=A0A1N7LAP1_9RHOB|nr:hypothetical protein [Roseivivax lentus]SIS70849.1 hypothetical protein SAMN05421759_102523 [Roseivivax lentus]
MIVLASALIGALWGGLSARRRKGNRLDIAQYATIFAIIGALLGLIATIVLEKALV